MGVLVVGEYDDDDDGRLPVGNCRQWQYNSRIAVVGSSTVPLLAPPGDWAALDTPPMSWSSKFFTGATEE